MPKLEFVYTELFPNKKVDPFGQILAEKKNIDKKR